MDRQLYEMENFGEVDDKENHFMTRSNTYGKSDIQIVKNLSANDQGVPLNSTDFQISGEQSLC